MKTLQPSLALVLVSLLSSVSGFADQVVLQSQEGQDFKVDVKVAKQSVTIKNLIDDAGVDAPRVPVMPVLRGSSPSSTAATSATFMSIAAVVCGVRVDSDGILTFYPLTVFATQDGNDANDQSLSTAPDLQIGNGFVREDGLCFAVMRMIRNGKTILCGETIPLTLHLKHKIERCF
jgi:hypothetical protein